MTDRKFYMDTFKSQECMCERPKKSRYSLTIRQIARELGISRTRVLQIEKAAIEKLRKRLTKIGITKELIDD